MNRTPHRPRRIAITYNLKRLTLQDGFKNDDEAEFDSPHTIDALRLAICALGHEVVVLEATPALPGALLNEQIDLVFNIAEGHSGRNREAQVPALLELLHIPYTGSDSKALTITLDKGLAKKVVSDAGVATPLGFVVHDAQQELNLNFDYPLIVKPMAEGSSKGISNTSVVHDQKSLQKAIEHTLTRYQQPALVEQFVDGREFTVGILEDERIEVLPPMEIVFLQDEPCPIYSYAYKLEWQEVLRYDTNPVIPASLRSQLESYAIKAFKALGCRDVARIDFRMDQAGNLFFLECNALPGLCPGWSDLCLISDAYGISHQELIERIMAPGLKRLVHSNE